MNHETQGRGTPPRVQTSTFSRVAVLSTAAAVLAGFFGGCSIWPQSLSLQSEPLPEAPQQVRGAKAPNQAPEPSTSVALPVSAVTATAIPPAAEVKAVEVTAPKKAAFPAPDTAQPVPVIPKVKPSVAIDATKPSHPDKSWHGYYVNVGLFAVERNARKAQQTLERAGLAVQTQEVRTKDAKATRIRVGPFVKQAQAKAAAKKIRAVKLDAVVVHH